MQHQNAPLSRPCKVAERDAGLRRVRGLPKVGHSPVRRAGRVASAFPTPIEPTPVRAVSRSHPHPTPQGGPYEEDRRMTRRLTLLLGLVTAMSLVIAPAAAAHGSTPHPFPSRIDLPDGFAPEGITSGTPTPWPGAKTLYVGSIADGAIWKGNAKTGTGKILVPGVSGRSALGLHLDWRGRLWVAGGDDAAIRVYNARTGALLKEYPFPTAGFVNDLVVTSRAIYATDSINQQLLVVPLGKHGGLLDPSKVKTVPLTGDISYGAGFNANGIVSRAGWLVIVQTNTGKLFRVNPWTGVTKAIDTHGADLLNGDGLLLRGSRLYVVRNIDDKVAVVTLSRRLTSARLIRVITSSSLDVPTTATFAAGRLYVVNARFGVADPTTTAHYWISRLRP